MKLSNLVARIVFGTLFLIASGFTYHFSVGHHGQLAAKMSFVAALLFALTINPPASPFSTTDTGVLLFYRNRLGVITGILLCLNIFSVIWIQMPHEMLSHFEGIVVANETIQGDQFGRSNPTVEYYDKQDIRHVFTDPTTYIVFQGKVFSIGEKVRIYVSQNPNARYKEHIDTPFLSRWLISLFLLGLNLFTAIGAVMCQVKYASLNIGSGV
jgi:hypothetical protein